MDGLPPERIREALEELTSWPPLARSPQLTRFLTYIVEAVLRGEAASIKAYAIAVDVFGRPQTFDPQSDPIVRVQARRLRALLDQFHAEGKGATGIRITLPVGRYVPEFAEIPERQADAAPRELARAMAEMPLPANANRDESPAESRRKPAPGPRKFALRLALAAVLALGAASALYFMLSEPRPPVPEPSPPPVTLPDRPVVDVVDFANLTGEGRLDGLGARLADELRSVLGRFENLTLTPTDHTGDAAAGYELSGVIHPATVGIEVVASLVSDGSTIWTRTFSEPLPPSGETTTMVAAAFSIARELGPFRGPLHEEGRRWLDDERAAPPAAGPYVCLLTYYLARETGDANDIANAIACNERLLGEAPDSAPTISATAWLETRALVNRALGAEAMAAQLDPPLAAAERAVSLAPDSSLAYEHLGSVRNWRQEYGLAEQAFVEALRLNPLNTDARASYAITLARAGKWQLGGEQAAIAIRDTPYPSPWYYYPAALSAYRAGLLQDAIDLGVRAAGFGGGEIGTLIALAAAADLERSDVIEQLLPRVMVMESLRRAGIVTWITGQIGDTEVLDRLTDGLVRAGVPEGALTAAF